jgi:hypothetical protein
MQIVRREYAERRHSIAGLDVLTLAYEARDAGFA